MFSAIKRLVIFKINFQQLLRYSLVSNIGTVLDFILLNVLISVYGWPLYEAVLVAFLSGALVCYFFHVAWTFKPKGKHKVKRFFYYLLTLTIGLTINLLIMYLLGGCLHWQYNIAKCFAVIVATVWNYNILKNEVFRGKIY